MTNISNRGGITLFLSLIFMVVLAVMAAGYIFMVTSSVRLVNAQQNDVKAFYLAEAGLNKAIWYLTGTAPDGSVDGSWRTAGYPQPPGNGVNDPQQESAGEGSYVIWVENTGAGVMITARGGMNDASRTIRQEFSSFAPVSIVADTWREI